MGCAGMSAHLSKGPVHRAVDWVVNHQHRDGAFDMRQRFLDDLESNRDYLDILNDALRAFLRAEGLPPPVGRQARRFSHQLPRRILVWVLVATASTGDAACARGVDQSHPCGQ